MLSITQFRYAPKNAGIISFGQNLIFQLDKVIGLQRLPALLSSVRAEHGERAEAVLLQTIRLQAQRPE